MDFLLIEDARVDDAIKVLVIFHLDNFLFEDEFLNRVFLHSFGDFFGGADETSVLTSLAFGFKLKFNC